jgi:hypothetical protein
MLGLALLPFYEEEARQQQAHGSTSPGRTLGADRHQAFRAPRASEHAAKVVGSSGRSVAKAKRVETKAPDLAEKVKTGELSLDKADKQVSRREKERDEQSARAVVLAPVASDAAGARWKMFAADFR